MNIQDGAGASLFSSPTRHSSSSHLAFLTRERADGKRRVRASKSYYSPTWEKGIFN